MSQPESLSRREMIATVGAAVAGAAFSHTALADASAPTPQMPVGGGLRAAELLDPSLFYLNNATLGCCPRVVIETVDAAARAVERNPADEAFGPFIEQMEVARAKAARFLGCAKDNLAITRSTTDGMNLIAQGIDLQPGDHVLTTDHEHPGGAACWEYYAARRGVVIDRVELPLKPQNAHQIAELFAAKVMKATKVVSVSHVTYTTGLRLPIARIAEAVKASGALLVVDGAQAPGPLAVDVTSLGCHAYATSAHKGLLGPKGTGLLYIAPGVEKRIDPLELHQGRQTYTGVTGTRNIASILGLGAAVDYLANMGSPVIESHVMKLRASLLAGLATIKGIDVISPPNGELASSIVTFVPPAGVTIYALQDVLRKKHNIVVGAKDRVNGIRISLHLYSGSRDVDAVIAALRAEIKA